MDNHYLVIFKDNRRSASPYEGHSTSVVEWLKEKQDVSPYEVYSPYTKKYYSVRDFLKFIAFEDYVPKFYVMDPKTEDMLPNGRHLVNGMKVLFASPNERGRPEEMGDEDWKRSRVLKYNRWCTVTHLSVDDVKTSFIGLYGDGTKVQWTEPMLRAWFVKIDSIEGSLKNLTKRWDDVYKIVKDSLSVESETMEVIDALAEETTKKILGLL